MLDAPRLHAIKLRQQLKTYQRIIRIFFPLFCLLSALGCGYTIQGKASLPFRSVSIGQIVNKTYQPKLEDKLQTALVAELMKNGIALENGSAYRIEGVITTYQLNTLAAAAGTAVEYEVIIRGDFKLVEPSGKIKALKGGGVFIVSFSSQGNLEDVIALRDQAIERALKDLSTELVISLIYP
ncbi:MAG TPA: hypothetical protein DCP92_06480 [Nitrospiraceae bacterium]|nr:hypothetical protein [Nitrospiraceae bacterium]